MGHDNLSFAKSEKSGHLKWVDAKNWQQIDRLEGNPSRRLIEETGIEALGSPFIPEHLSDDARGCINIIKQSMPSSVYSALDSFLLSAFATAWATHKRAAHEMALPDFNGRPQVSAAVRKRVHGSELQINRLEY